MTLKIIHKNNTSSGQAPAPSDLDIGEIGVNAADAKLYIEDTNGVVQEFISNFEQTGNGSVARSVESKLQDFVSVKDFGATGDGVTDDTTAIENAINSGTKIYFPSGTYIVDGLSISGDNKTFVGDNYRQTTIKAISSSGYGITLSGSQHVFQDLQFLGSSGTTNLIQTSGATYNLKFDRVRFFTCDVALDVQGNFYWSTFVNCYWKDCNTGVLSPNSQTLNAVTFSACTFWHASPTSPSTNDCLDVNGSEGITLQGCNAQNQGVKFTNCDGISISGGYWECYDRPAFDLTTSGASFEGIKFLPGSLIKIDANSAAKIQGLFVNFLAASSTTGVTCINNNNAVFFASRQLINLFPDTSCSTDAAAAALTYSPTASSATPAINGDGHVEFTMSSTQRNGFDLGESGGFYVKYKVTSGTAQLRATGGASNIITVDSTVDSDWRYYRTNAPAIYFQPTTTSATVVVDEFVACPGEVFVRGVNDVITKCQFEDGSAGGPSVGIGTRNTGLFQNSDGDLAFSVEGVEKASFTSSGDLILDGSQQGTKSVSLSNGSPVTVLSTAQPGFGVKTVEVTVNAIANGNCSRTAKFLWTVNGQLGSNTRQVDRIFISTSSNLNSSNRTFSDITATATTSGSDEILQITVTHGGAISFSSTGEIFYRTVTGTDFS